jgi:uncharacterized protein
MEEKKRKMQQKKIHYWSEGIECAGTLYLPDTLSVAHKAPAVVLGHGTTYVKEMHLPHFAQTFVDAGLIALAIDYRYLGESRGEPRYKVDPREQAQDYSNAITWLQQQPEVDAEHIGVWGTSKSGGIVLQVAAFDRRVKAVVAQVPDISFWYYMANALPPEAIQTFLDLMQEERAHMSAGGTPRQLRFSAPAGEASIVGPDWFSWFEQAEREFPTYRNAITVRSIEYMATFDAGAFIHLIAPTPLLMILAEKDEFIPVPFNRAHFDRAGEPKRLFTYDGGHTASYDDPATREITAGVARDWFVQHLLGEGRAEQ